MEEKMMIACCGLDCSSCEARIATVRDDDQLRAKVASEWSEMNHAPEITPETINCSGCRIDGCKFYYCSHLCVIRQCCQSKGFGTCSECAEIGSCRKIAGIIESNPDALENLNSLR